MSLKFINMSLKFSLKLTLKIPWHLVNSEYKDLLFC